MKGQYTTSQGYLTELKGMMQHSLLKKGLVIGIIILFVSTSTIPGIQGASQTKGASKPLGPTATTVSRKPLVSTSLSPYSPVSHVAHRFQEPTSSSDDRYPCDLQLTVIFFQLGQYVYFVEFVTDSTKMYNSTRVKITWDSNIPGYTYGEVYPKWWFNVFAIGYFRLIPTGTGNDQVSVTVSPIGWFNDTNEQNNHWSLH